MANGHGGRRTGAGRPSGVTKAGRALRAVARSMLADLVGTERDPLLIAIEIAADEKQPAPLRLEAALGAAKYLHPALSAQAVAVTHKPAEASVAVSTILDRLAKLTPSEGPVIDVPAEAAERAA
jgi:hypothetical protein